MKLVIIGASAGGLEPIRQVLEPLPPDLDAAVLVIRHLPRDQPERLTAILEQATDLDVTAATDEAPLLPGRVYVAQPGLQLGFCIVSGGPAGWRPGLSCRPAKDADQHVPSIDHALQAAAPLFGRNLVAVILSGRLDDGTQGALELADWCGVTVAQDPLEADYASMPLSVITHDHPRHIVKASEIPDVLVELAGRTGRRMKKGPPSDAQPALEG